MKKQILLYLYNKEVISGNEVINLITFNSEVSLEKWSLLM